MTRLAIVAGIVLALSAGPLAVYPQDKETAPEDTMAQQTEHMGDRSALWEQIKATADEDPRVMAGPIPETPDLLPGLWEQIRANAVEDPRVAADPIPETPDLLPGLWEQIRANAVEDPRVAADPIPETPDLLPGLWEQIKANADELQSQDE